MAQHYLSLYRNIVREVNRASIAARPNRNPLLASQFREVFEAHRHSKPEELQQFEYDMQAALTFMRAQRTHKALLERYNPLFDLTAEERIEATARRVGLDMPVTPGKSDGET